MREPMTPEALAEFVATSPYPDLNVDQIIRALEAMFPGARHGSDFIVGWFVDPATNKGGGRAFLLSWKREEDEPSGADIDDFVAANEATVLPEPTPPLPVLTPRQLLLAARSIGLTEADILSQIDGIGGEEPSADDLAAREVAHIEWAKATSYDRTHWLVDELRTAMGFTELEFDDLWRWGATL